MTVTNCGAPDTYTNAVLVPLFGDCSPSPLDDVRIWVTVRNVDFVGDFGVIVVVIVDARDKLAVITFVDAPVVRNARWVDVVPCGGSVVVILGNGPKAGLALLIGDVGSGGDMVGAAI